MKKKLFLFLFLFMPLMVFVYFSNLNIVEKEYYGVIEIIEIKDSDAIPVSLKKIIDGDTIVVNLWNEEKRIRIVGYDAYEKNTPKGSQATNYLKSLCEDSSVYLDVDDLEPKDKYGRTLGYVWCKKQNNKAYVSVTKSFLLLRPDLIEKTLEIPPDEHPYKVWLSEHNLKIISDRTIKIVLYNISGSYTFYERNITLKLTGGIYKIKSNIFVNSTFLNLLTEEEKRIILKALTLNTQIVTEEITTTLTKTITVGLNITTKVETKIFTTTKTITKEAQVITKTEEITLIEQIALDEKIIGLVLAILIGIIMAILLIKRK